MTTPQFVFHYNNHIFEKHVLKKLLTVGASREGSEGQREKDGRKILSLFTILYGFSFLNSGLYLYLLKQNKE